MNIGLEALENICNKGCDYCDKWHYEHNLFCKRELGGCSKCVFCGNEKEIIEKEIKALEIITNLFDIKIIGDYLIAQKGDVCIVENPKLKQSQEIINLLKEVLL